MLSVDDINKLKNDYIKLEKMYDDVLKLTKLNADSNEFVIRVLEQKLKKIQDIAETMTSLPCLTVDCDCANCTDELTNNGKTCMKYGMKMILNIIMEGDG